MPQPHSTHVGAVSWEPHCSSPTTCVGKAVQELYPDLCASKYKLNARGTHTPTHGLAKQLSMAATAWGIWLCACVRYWQGRWVVYVCPLLYICPHARTVRERSRDWGWGRNIALFQRPKVYVVDNIGVLHAWILALNKHTDTIRI